MKSAAPNRRCTGSHADVPTNPRPNREIAGLALSKSVYAIQTSTPTPASAASPVSTRRSGSPIRSESFSCPPNRSPRGACWAETDISSVWSKPVGFAGQTGAGLWTTSGEGAPGIPRPILGTVASLHRPLAELVERRLARADDLGRQRREVELRPKAL